jgi:hypothetical protein
MATNTELRQRAKQALAESMRSNNVQLRLTSGQQKTLVSNATKRAERKRKALRRQAA